MREAADHLPHGGETFALNNLLFQFFLHGHVADGYDHAGRPAAFGVQEGACHAEHRAPATIFVPRAVFAGRQ